jgi:hypothetical protein
MIHDSPEEDIPSLIRSKTEILFSELHVLAKNHNKLHPPVILHASLISYQIGSCNNTDDWTKYIGNNWAL